MPVVVDPGAPGSTPGFVSPSDLAAYLPRATDAGRALTAIRVASGWLRTAVGLNVWPSPLPDELWAWAIELAAIAYVNPAGLSMHATGEVADRFSPTRRDEILAAAARYTGGAGRPRGAFPAVVPMPDPPWRQYGGGRLE